jgi:predicted metal-binding membrane protein
MRSVHGGSPFVPVMAGLIGTSWVALWLWEQSPYGRYLEHGRWTDIGPAAVICAALPAGSVLLPALLYAGGWLLMSIAMMLPTTLPLLNIFRRIIDARPDRVRLLALIIAGYLLTWAAFAIGAHLVDALLHRAVGSLDFLMLNGWVLGALVLTVAGLFQFSQLKYRCLDKCRTPLGFVTHHWGGRTPLRDAFRLGLHHGAYCVGCCWALMLLMFVVGTGSVGWMLALGAVMAFEKNVPWGRLVSRKLGYGLLAWAAAVVFLNVSA